MTNKNFEAVPTREDLIDFAMPLVRASPATASLERNFSRSLDLWETTGAIGPWKGWQTSFAVQRIEQKTQC